MKWNMLLLIISLSMLTLFACGDYIQHWAEAEAIAELLAPRIDVQEDILRSDLQDILKRFRLSTIIVDCTPWAIMSILLAVRILADMRNRARPG